MMPDRPPSTAMIWPVIQLASGLMRNAARPATSSGYRMKAIVLAWLAMALTMHLRWPRPMWESPSVLAPMLPWKRLMLP